MTTTEPTKTPVTAMTDAERWREFARRREALLRSGECRTEREYDEWLEKIIKELEL